jgi:hypothetical protein
MVATGGVAPRPLAPCFTGTLAPSTAPACNRPPSSPSHAGAGAPQHHRLPSDLRPLFRWSFHRSLQSRALRSPLRLRHPSAVSEVKASGRRATSVTRQPSTASGVPADTPVTPSPVVSPSRAGLPPAPRSAFVAPWALGALLTCSRGGDHPGGVPLRATEYLPRRGPSAAAPGISDSRDSEIRLSDHPC